MGQSHISWLLRAPTNSDPVPHCDWQAAMIKVCLKCSLHDRGVWRKQSDYPLTTYNVSSSHYQLRTRVYMCCLHGPRASATGPPTPPAHQVVLDHAPLGVYAHQYTGPILYTRILFFYGNSLHRTPEITPRNPPHRKEPQVERKLKVPHKNMCMDKKHF